MISRACAHVCKGAACASERRHDRIEHEPGGHRHERDADNHTARREHVGHHVPSVRDERRRLPAAAPGQQKPRPDSVDETCPGIDRETNDRRFERLRRKKAKIGGAEDRKSRYYDQHAFEDRRKVFCLLVAVRVIGVSRSGRDAQGRSTPSANRRRTSILARRGLCRRYRVRPSACVPQVQISCPARCPEWYCLAGSRLASEVCQDRHYVTVGHDKSATAEPAAKFVRLSFRSRRKSTKGSIPTLLALALQSDDARRRCVRFRRNLRRHSRSRLTSARSRTARHRPPPLVSRATCRRGPMFLAADIVVKVVMVSLAFASLRTWTIFFAINYRMCASFRTSPCACRSRRGTHAI